MEGGDVFIQPGSLRSPGPGTALRAMGYSSSKPDTENRKKKE